MSWAERVLPCDLARIMFYYIERRPIVGMNFITSCNRHIYSFLSESSDHVRLEMTTRTER